MDGISEVRRLGGTFRLLLYTRPGIADIQLLEGRYKKYHLLGVGIVTSVETFGAGISRKNASPNVDSETMSSRHSKNFNSAALPQEHEFLKPVCRLDFRNTPVYN